ncbi:carbohydrate kinase [candidate division KSB1 bacterium]|nr:MAG: carbohydrate kinase [candidate division KSB1 bacterium]RKY90429.1 MAG: carbohydrate kinase [candidate division KSB1 bacterium]
MITYKIAGLGEVLWDVYQDAKYLGGAPANFALHAQRLGAEGIIISRVGDDLLGKELLALLNKWGVKTEAIQIDPHKPTGTVHVKLDAKGVPTFTCSQDVAFDYLEFDEKLKMLLPQLDAVLYGTLIQRNSVARKTVQRALNELKDVLVVFDVNFREVSSETEAIVSESLRKTDILKINETELQMLQEIFDGTSQPPGDFLERLLEEFSLRLVCLTLGENGCYCQSSSERYYSPGFRIQPVDTTGAGDAFIAAFVISYLQAQPLPRAMEFANAVGALVAGRNGAVPPYTRQDIDQFLQKDWKRNVDKQFEKYWN